MSFPNVPNVEPKITVNDKDAARLLLLSIAFEELSLAHIMNAEAEKIQSVIGTLEGHSVQGYPKFDDLVEINEVVNETLDLVIIKECLLTLKFDKVLRFLKAVKEDDQSTSTPTP
jgi:hypothetical protein